MICNWYSEKIKGANFFMKKEHMISVIMPNYNTPLPFLKEAVNSILNQTYKDFEFIIIDDYSTDGSYEYLLSLGDPRITLVRNNSNLGVTASLNIGLHCATGKYIARMDSDDISLPERFEQQLKFMNENKDVIVCGTFAEEIGDSNGKRCRYLPSQKTYQCGVIFGNVFGLIHPTAFFRAESLRENDIWYDENIKTAQDYAMWATCCRYGRISNVEKILFQYRIHKKQISFLQNKTQQICTMYTQKKQLQVLFPEISDCLVESHFNYCKSYHVTIGMRRWFQQIMEANNSKKYVDQDALHAFIDDFLCKKILIESKQTKNLIVIGMIFLKSTRKERKVLLKSLVSRMKNKGIYNL